MHKNASVALLHKIRPIGAGGLGKGLQDLLNSTRAHLYTWSAYTSPHNT